MMSLLVAHWIADFVCQTDDMAKNKSSSWGWLTWHADVYSCVMGTWAVIFLFPVVTFVQALSFFGLTFVTHFLTDAVTSRITRRLWFFKPFMDWNPPVGDPNHVDSLDCPAQLWYPVPGNSRHYFFVVIGLDQVIHYWTLLWTIRFLSF